VNQVWHFNRAKPGDRARESQVEKFFKSDAVVNKANALVREGIQNSLDAHVGEGPLVVRIRLGELHGGAQGEPLSKYVGRLFEHIGAAAGKLVEPPDREESCRYLAFEDFETTGLKGAPEQWWPEEGVTNPFFNFFRGEGVSNKDEGARGRHGVGKHVFAAASRVRGIFGLTSRADGRRLLMGTAVLPLHTIAGAGEDGGPGHFQPDGWFGWTNEDGLVLPVENDPLVDSFVKDFGLAREMGDGLSIVVPWLHPAVDVLAITEAVVRGYFYPILRGELVVHITGPAHGEPNTIDGASLHRVISALRDAYAAIGPDEAKHGDKLVSQMKPILALAEWALTQEQPTALLPASGPSPKWDSTLIPDAAKAAFQQQLAAGQSIAARATLRVRPKNGDETYSSFDAYFVRDPACADGQIVFIREGLIITDARPRRIPGIRGLVVIDEGPLATFLGDAENPSHTQWQKDLVKDKYTYAPATVNFVTEAIPSIVTILGDAQQAPDPTLLVDLFSIPADKPTGTKGKKKQDKVQSGPTPPETPPIPPPKPKRYRIERSAGGFVVRPGPAGSTPPPILELKVAYGVRRGSAFSKWTEDDFAFGNGDIEAVAAGAEVVRAKENVLVLRITETDFEVFVNGFDENRDLEIDPTVKEADDASQD
jgi:hypothetical protein